MEQEKILYAIPYFLSFGLSLTILIYTWRKRVVRGAQEFSYYLFGQTLWLFGFFLELIAHDQVTKIFWDKFQWFAAVVVLITVPLFALKYANYKIKNAKLFFNLSLIVPILFSILLFSDSFTHWIYLDPHLITTGIFPELNYQFNFVIYFFAAYTYLIIFSSLIFMIVKSQKKNKLGQYQLITISIGMILPVFGTMFSLLGIQITPQRDPTPYSTVIGNLIIALGLFRFRVFDILPIAREIIIENMDDLVIVLDATERVVDMNKSALQELKLTPQKAFGLPAQQAFAAWPEIIEHFSIPQNQNSEIIFQYGDQYYHFDVKSTTLLDPQGNYQGRILVARDISLYAQLRWELQDLNKHLEVRVEEKTRELTESYETTLEGWAKALELRDKETEGHSRRVTEKTVQLARAYGIQEEEIIHIRRGAILHDIGKMAIPDEILRKTSNLNEEERHIIEKHPEIAYHLLESIPYLQKALIIPYCHHEHWDGTGYPRGLKGEEIPIQARLFTIIDIWDALLSDRSYSKAWSLEDAVQFIQINSGKIFDPQIASFFLEMVAKGTI